MSCDPQELISANPCVNAINSPFTLEVLKTVLLCQILASVTTGPGSISFLSGHGAPEGVVVGERLGQTYYDLDTGALSLFGGTVGTTIGWGP